MLNNCNTAYITIYNTTFISIKEQLKLASFLWVEGGGGGKTAL